MDTNEILDDKLDDVVGGAGVIIAAQSTSASVYGSRAGSTTGSMTPPPSTPAHLSVLI